MNTSFPSPPKGLWLPNIYHKYSRGLPSTSYQVTWFKSRREKCVTLYASLGTPSCGSSSLDYRIWTIFSISSQGQTKQIKYSKKILTRSFYMDFSWRFQAIDHVWIRSWKWDHMLHNRVIWAHWSGKIHLQRCLRTF